MSRLIFAGDGLRTLGEHLLSSDLERGALLLAQPVSVPPDSYRLLVTETILLNDEAYSRQSQVGLEIPPQVLAPVIKRARDTHQSIVLAHTHPWDGRVEPSHIDRSGEALLLPVFFRRASGVPHARL